jgi:hypothetical protein
MVNLGERNIIKLMKRAGHVACRGREGKCKDSRWKGAASVV